MIEIESINVRVWTCETSRNFTGEFVTGGK